MSTAPAHHRQAHEVGAVKLLVEVRHSLARVQARSAGAVTQREKVAWRRGGGVKWKGRRERVREEPAGQTYEGGGEGLSFSELCQAWTCRAVPCPAREGFGVE